MAMINVLNKCLLQFEYDIYFNYTGSTEEHIFT